MQKPESIETSESECRKALGLLFQRLRENLRPPAQTVRESRGQYIIALHELAQFFKLTGAGKDIAQSFIQLALALFDIERGAAIPELLRPQKAYSRRVDPTDVWMTRAHAAAALECFIRGGTEERKATKLIIKQCPEIAKAVRDRSRDVETSLVYWRKALTEKSPKNEIAIDIFHSAIAILDSLALPVDFNALGEHMLVGLSRQAAKLPNRS